MNNYVITDYIGKTPIVKLHAINCNNSEIYVKLEEFNPGGSIKSRIAYQMIVDAEKKGIININNPESVTIIEPTGGNTGIGLAQVCSIRRYKCILVVPDNYSKVRIKVLQDLGASVLLSESASGNDSHIKLASDILKKNPNYVLLDQFSNPSNPSAHYQYTGPEIIDKLGRVDLFVCGIGSGGSITGIGRALKEHYPECKVIGVQPTGCVVLSGKAIPHKIQGIAIGIIPKVLEKSIIDDMIDVSEEEVFQCKEFLAKNEGIYVGISSAANIRASQKVAVANKRNLIIVTIAPDGGRNY